MRGKKQQLRAEALRHRESIPPTELRLPNQLIQERTLRILPYLLSRSVALYSPIGNEVATEKIQYHALSVGKKLFYPKLGSQGKVDLAQVESSDDMALGRYGILEPVGSKILSAQDRPGLIVFVPGLLFDFHGNRLGRGNGWYDRLLKLLGEEPRFVALAYEFQVIEQLQADEWDQKVQHIITEKRTINCDGISSRSGRAS